MTLIKYNPYVRKRYPGTFVNLFDKFFYDSLEDSSVDRFLPKANIIETEKTYEVHMAVPGMQKEDFNINLEDGKLIISGERNFENGEGITLHQQEILNGSFSRVFHLPEDADHKKISASYVDGILGIEVQKDVKKALKQKIDVK
jgi:HSP20 family protein